MAYDIKFTDVDGQKDKGQITMYALSTCGFCRLAMDFLKTNSIKFRYVYIDELDYSIRVDVKTGLEWTYKTKIGYPFLVLPNDEFLVGFVKMIWEEKLRDQL